MTLGQKADRMTQIINELIDLRVRLALADAIRDFPILRGATHDRIASLNKELSKLLFDR